MVGTVICDGPINPGCAERHDARWPRDADQRGRQRRQTEQTAALSIRRMGIPAGVVATVRSDPIHILNDRALMSVRAGVIVRATVAVNVLRRGDVVNVGHTRNVIFVGQAWRKGMLAWQRERCRRRKHAKQIDEGQQPPRVYALCLCQSDQRRPPQREQPMHFKGKPITGQAGDFVCGVPSAASLVSSDRLWSRSASLDRPFDRQRRPAVKVIIPRQRTPLPWMSGAMDPKKKKNFFKRASSNINTARR
jgi:hypothetical protein